MKYNQFQRTELLLGKDNIKILQQKRVAVIGLGGVGSYATEALARAGISHFLLIDFDKVNLSNLNRQLIALHETIGMQKTEVMSARIKSINPKAEVECITDFLDKNNRSDYLNNLDYVIDAIDALGPKIGLLEYCLDQNIPVLSVMGAGNRLDPQKVELGGLSKTWNCPLARRVRKTLHHHGYYQDLPIVFSFEKPLQTDLDEDEEADEIICERGRKRKLIGSISYLPAVMGLFAASYVIRDLLSIPINLK
ncbi:MAG TPA: tRNA threonylcarbamoyladenosine dehydratase [Candidatus Cloacimonadota bacterium]|nr:tRNA threonylcarbamoyladenosine dehydratase [Candidatus Cloacimonadota bacterium]HQL14227.1 tRNA threonylcarbamoyladenosine dehydratase [Candidatus Cloacimonadota bacterium]